MAIWRCCTGNRNSLRSGSLFFELFPERLFALDDVRRVAGGIDERIRASRFQPRELRFHFVVASVRAEENVARQRFENPERSFVVRRDLRIGGVVYKLVAGIHIRATDDHDVVVLAVLVNFERPGGAAPRVAGREVRRQDNSAQPHLVAVVQNTADLRRRMTSHIPR
jgi:hypothetical protein